MQELGNVKFVGSYGSDLQIALAAWTSTSRELTEAKVNRVPKMVEDLYTNKHMTCFERGILHFLVETDIASHIHIIKHRTVGTNGESARYKELKEDKFYIPEDFNYLDIEDVTTLNKYQGYYTWAQLLEAKTNELNELYHACLKDATPILGRKRAKESARYFKGYNSVITTDVIMNMSAFSNFYKQRHSDKAQKEISDIAERMMTIAENIEDNPFETTLRMIKNQ